MEHNNFDQEYYVMSMDGANNHPLLAWGKTRFSPFLKAREVNISEYDLPLNIIFDEPYPIKYEMADLLMLATLFAVSKNFKELFEKMNIYGVQFVPVDIKSNQGTLITGHHVLHIWNKLEAIDKNNYIGGELDMFNSIHDLKKFSLDKNLLNGMPLEKRLVFGLIEKKTIILVHQSVYDTIQSASLTGIKFFRVDEWDDNAIFR